MTHYYSNDEKTDMILIYGECRKNATAAADLYLQRYPNRAHHPVPKTFRELEAKLRQEWPPHKKIRVRTATGQDNEVAVLQEVDENPHISQRALARQLQISRRSVGRILRANKFHPYHISLVQELKPTDYPKRVQFCNFIRRQINLDENFLDKILFSDEAKFSNNGAVNRHNCHYYAQENPRWIRETHFQTVFAVNVWCGIINEHVIGPHFFDGNLNGEMYLHFLQMELPLLLENLDLNTRHGLWLQQDGAPPHFHRNVRHYLDQTFENRWIGRGSNNIWPSRSPDLTPLDFFLWGAVKEKVYETPIQNVEDLKNRIQHECRAITPITLRRVRQSFLNRLNTCVRANGQHFEHLLH